ncbi:MAG TPA: MFS transporter [Actinomycetota bacterium]|nr:MFS transporter [Actinomycetota bacterium]
MSKVEDRPASPGAGDEFGGFAEEPVTLREVAPEPNFFKSGKASFKQQMRDALDYKKLRHTPYGLKPVMLFMIIGIVGAFDSGIVGQAAPEILNDIEIDIIRYLQIAPLVGAVTTLVYFVLAYYMDRIRRVPFVGLGYIISGVFSMATTTTKSASGDITRFVSTRAFDSVGDQFRNTPTSSLIADYYPVEDRGKVIAFTFSVGSTVGLMVPLLVAFLVEKYGWRPPLIASGVLMIFAGIVAFLGLREPIRGYMERRSIGMSEEDARIPEEPPSIGTAWRTMWSIRLFRRLFIASIPGGMGAAIWARAFPFWLRQEFGLDVSDRTLINFGVGLALLPFVFLSGGLIDGFTARRPSRVLILVGVIGVLSAVANFFVALGPPLWVLIGLVFLFNIGNVLTSPARSLLFLQIVPANMRTFGFAVQTVALIPVQLLNFFIIGAVGTRYGLQGTMLIAAPFLLLAAMIDLSAAPLYDRDLRAAIASQGAALEYKRAIEEGRRKQLVCRDIDVEYDGVQVLFGVDFDVEEGDIIALLGTNGAGKSTLLKAIAGIQEASSGAIVYDGRDITHIPPHEITPRGVVLMPGGKGVFPGLSVHENLVLGNWLNDDKEAKARMAEAFRIFPILKERENSKAALLSGGEQQMLALAQAFMAKPKLLMIDELSLGLSPAVVQQLIEVVKAIHATGVTVILVEQSVNVALTVAERAIFMEKGEVKFVGATKDLLTRPDILRAVYVKGTGALTGAAPGGAQKSDRELRSYELSQARAILQVQGISKSFGGIKAVDDVSLDLREGEILGIIGPNGAGKTTVFDLICGYQDVDSGKIVYDGVDVTGMSPDERAKRRLIRRFQDARLFPSLTVYENVLVALERKLDVRSVTLAALQVPQVRAAERRVRLRADRLIELLDLDAFRDKFVKELSTGLRRITDLACVLAAEPRVLLLDEPSSGIAQAEAEMLAPLLRRVRFETGCSILIIEHDMPLISSISDELLAMEQGRTVIRGAPDDVLNDERVIQSYLGTSEEVIKRSGLLT